MYLRKPSCNKQRAGLMEMKPLKLRRAMLCFPLHVSYHRSDIYLVCPQADKLPELLTLLHSPGHFCTGNDISAACNCSLAIFSEAPSLRWLGLKSK